MNEVWKDIPEYEGLYQVSNLGRVKSLKRKIFLKPRLTQRGYVTVVLYRNSVPNSFQIHRLIAFVFIPNPDNKPQVNHKNGVKTDNRVENLEWVTNYENCIHAHKNGFVAKPNPRRGEDTYNHKLTEKDIDYIRKHYIRKHKIFGSTGLAEQFNVSSSLILSIVKKLKWKHI